MRTGASSKTSWRCYSAAEQPKKFFSSVSTGAADDIDKATEIARAMVTRYGMSDELGLLTFDRQSSPFLDGRLMERSHNYSERTAQLIDAEIMKIINSAFAQALKTVGANKCFLEKSVGFLIERECLEEDELKALWIQNSDKSDGMLRVVTADHK